MNSEKLLQKIAATQFNPKSRAEFYEKLVSMLAAEAEPGLVLGHHQADRAACQ